MVFGGMSAKTRLIRYYFVSANFGTTTQFDSCPLVFVSISERRDLLHADSGGNECRRNAKEMNVIIICSSDTIIICSSDTTN